MKIYIIKSHDESILGKDFEWLDGANGNLIFSTPHRDIALNQLIELNAKDINLRAQIIECEADKKGRPIMLLDSAAATNSEPCSSALEDSIQSDAA
ncbi:MAG: hypothetical protein P8H31_06680 [Porticoccaceae bacterium]|nr:hypothetical protein [Porticoccaceae bacterium]